MSETTKSFWHSAGYIPWFTADTASAVGAALRALAISLLGYAVSGSTIAAGWLGTSSMIAQQVASVFGGTFVDRHDRKRLIVANAVVGVLAWGAIAVLLLCGALSFPVLLLIAVLASGINGFFGSATDAMLRSIIDIRYYPKARSLNEGRDATIAMAGSPIGGFLYSIAPWLPFLASACMYAVGGVAATGIRLITVDAADDFLEALKGVSEPERKRKIIGEKFIRTFEKAQRQVLEEAGARGKEVKFLVQGTLYPDVVESGGGDGAANIKSHHNVGGLPKDIKFQLIEPLRTLFKDEVRAIGTELGLPDEIVWRQPFPGPGLGIRIIGEITKERLDLLREADAIAREELSKAGLDRDIWQCPVVLLADVHSVGVQGDERTYGSPIVLRPVSSEDAMTADWSRIPYDVLATISTRITNECRQINRVVLDCTSKPPATIEWE